MDLSYANLDEYSHNSLYTPLNYLVKVFYDLIRSTRTLVLLVLVLPRGDADTILYA